MKKYLIFILAIPISFIGGYCTSILIPQQNKIDIFGTYIQDFSTISINHDSTYQFTYPFTEGDIIIIDENTCKLKDGNLNDFILIFSKDSLKLIDTKSNIVKNFSKSTSLESQLEENH